MSIPFSLVAVPNKSSFNKLQQIINEIAQKHHSVIFEPHMTLYGRFTGEKEWAIDKTKQLSEQLKQLPGTTSSIEMSTTFYQCVFARIKTTKEIINAHLMTRKIFNIDEYHVFMPHISLVYGDFDIETRQDIIDQIKFPEIELVLESIQLLDISLLESNPGNFETVAEFKLS